MQCKTFSHLDPDTGKNVTKPKLFYNTWEAANEKAVMLNLQVDRVLMLAAYRCTVCGKFHVGKNGKNITRAYREKIRNSTFKLRGLKILGTIDLTAYKKGNQKL